jgi:hypothetical protein
MPVTFARVNRTLILCQSPSKEPLALEFELERTKDTIMHSLSLPCKKSVSSALEGQHTGMLKHQIQTEQTNKKQTMVARKPQGSFCWTKVKRAIIMI